MTRKFAICALLLVLLTVVPTNGQEQLPRVIPTMSRETHSKLFDILFPLDALHSNGNQFVIVLRYNTSLENNEQIILIGREGKVHLTEYISNGNLWQKGNDIFERTRRDDPKEIAKLIGVRKREFDVPFATVRSWRRGLLAGVAMALGPKPSEKPGLPKTKTGTVILDGTVYEIWDQSQSGELHYELYSGEVTDRIYADDPLLVRWMKTIRRDAAKHRTL